MKKRCTLCYKTKNESLFYKYKKNKDGFTCYCKVCHMLVRKRGAAELRSGVLNNLIKQENTQLSTKKTLKQIDKVVDDFMQEFRTILKNTNDSPKEIFDTLIVNYPQIPTTYKNVLYAKCVLY